jgi:hypothetical protein
MTPFIVSLLIKVTLILALGLIASASLRSFGPSVRHQVLLVTLGSCLLLPVVMMLAPRWDVRMLPSVGAANAPSPGLSSRFSNADTRSSTPSAQPPGIAATPPAAPLNAWSRTASLPVVWALGFLAVLAWLTAGRIRLRRIASGSWPLTGADWERALSEESREVGVSRPIRLLSS